MTSATGTGSPDLWAVLDQQRRFLAGDCARFDAGEIDWAARIAVGLRVLVHDTRQSTSLLKQLGVKDSLIVRCSSRTYTPEEVARDFPYGGSVSPLATMAVTAGGPETGVRWEAQTTGELHGAEPVAQWWGGIVSFPTTSNLLRRRDFVLTMANRMGGAHVDHDYADAWAAHERHGQSAFVIMTTRRPEPHAPENVVPYVVRSIAYELTATLDAEYGPLI